MEQANDPALAEMTPPQKKKVKGADQGKYAFGSSIEKSKMLKLPAIHS